MPQGSRIEMDVQEEQQHRLDLKFLSAVIIFLSVAISINLMGFI